MDERERDLNAYLQDLEDVEREIARLTKENKTLRSIARDLHLPARRYADGRMSYVTSMVNSCVQTLLDLGVELNMSDGTPFARDGMGRKFDGLSDEEASKGERLEMWRYSVLTEGFETC